jgi:hypothetical protein
MRVMPSPAASSRRGAGGPIVRRSGTGRNSQTEPAAPRTRPPGRGHPDRPAGLRPDSPPRERILPPPPAGERGHQGQPPPALGVRVQKVQRTSKRNRRTARVSHRDPRHAIQRARHRDDKHAAGPRQGVRNSVRAQLRHAGHEHFPGRAADQQFAHETARRRHGRGRPAERADPRTRRSPRRTHRLRGPKGPEGTHVEHRVGTAHCRSPPDDKGPTLSYERRPRTVRSTSTDPEYHRTPSTNTWVNRCFRIFRPFRTAPVRRDTMGTEHT